MQDNSNYIEAKDLLAATNEGLDIILYLYPQAEGAQHDRRKKFKLREEKSASANLYRAEDGIWLVTDFGDDSKPRNGIGCYMLEQNVSYGIALRELAAKFNLTADRPPEELNKAEFSEQPALPDQPDNEWTTRVNPKGITQLDIDTIISKNVIVSLNWKHRHAKDVAAAVRKNIEEKFAYYRWHSLESYSLVKNRKVLTFSATDTYPIFLIDEGSHKKLYQPLHPDKSKRFMYMGEKPADFIHGLAQLKKKFEENKKDVEGEKNEVKENYDRTGINSEEDDHDARVEQTIICSGGSDAINVALLGYEVLWLNSETAKLHKWQYDEIMLTTISLYQLTDIDTTGKSAAHEVAMAYLDLFTIELPENLKNHRDKRRNPCKDVRDYLNHYPSKEFHELVKIALRYRFWDPKPRYEGKGEDRVRVGWSYQFDNVSANNFLSKNGFGRLLVGDKKTEWTYVHKIGNIVREVDADIVQNFLHDFLEHRRLDKDLRNAMLQTSRLNDSSLSRLKIFDIEFEDYTRDSQFFFFRNKTVEVRKDEIIYHKPGSVSRFIWEEDQLQHSIEKTDNEPFVITKDDELGTYNIQVKNLDCYFLKYLVQTSRAHWRTELETGEKFMSLTPAEQDHYKEKHRCCIDGPNLSAQEVDEQKQHLVNKIFAIGYLLHHYHDRTKGWFVYAMDNKFNDDGKSHGGSGKSILFDVAMRKMLPKNFFINGRNSKLNDDPHKYDGLTEHHKYILVDDAHEYLRLDNFYTDITSDIQVNPKGKKPFAIPFERSGKFAFTTNYTPRDLGPSTERRQLPVAFSDFYHNKGESDDYKELRDIKSDLGVSFFEDFERKDYNNFYQTMLHCLKFFLGTTEKIRPAMEGVNRRNLFSRMGQAFHDWAIAYFAPDSDRLDKYFVREQAYKVFNTVNKGEVTPQEFRERMRAYCRYYGYRLNPREYLNKEGKIIQKVEAKIFRKELATWEPVAGAPKEPKELWFIQTRDELPADPMVGWPVEPENDESSIF